MMSNIPFSRFLFLSTIINLCLLFILGTPYAAVYASDSSGLMNVLNGLIRVKSVENKSPDVDGKTKLGTRAKSRQSSGDWEKLEASEIGVESATTRVSIHDSSKTDVKNSSANDALDSDGKETSLEAQDKKIALLRNADYEAKRVLLAKCIHEFKPDNFSDALVLLNWDIVHAYVKGYDSVISFRGLSHVIKRILFEGVESVPGPFELDNDFIYFTDGKKVHLFSLKSSDSNLKVDYETSSALEKACVEGLKVTRDVQTGIVYAFINQRILQSNQYQLKLLEEKTCTTTTTASPAPSSFSIDIYFQHNSRLIDAKHGLFMAWPNDKISALYKLNKELSIFGMSMGIKSMLSYESKIGTTDKTYSCTTNGQMVAILDHSSNCVKFYLKIENDIELSGLSMLGSMQALDQRIKNIVLGKVRYSQMTTFVTKDGDVCQSDEDGDSWDWTEVKSEAHQVDKITILCAIEYVNQIYVHELDFVDSKLIRNTILFHVPVAHHIIARRFVTPYIDQSIEYLYLVTLNNKDFESATIYQSPEYPLVAIGVEYFIHDHWVSVKDGLIGITPNGHNLVITSKNELFVINLIDTSSKENLSFV